MWYSTKLFSMCGFVRSISLSLSQLIWVFLFGFCFGDEFECFCTIFMCYFDQFLFLNKKLIFSMCGDTSNFYTDKTLMCSLLFIWVLVYGLLWTFCGLVGLFENGIRGCNLLYMLLTYCMQSFIFLFHTKMLWWVFFKVFQKYRLSKSFLPWTFLQSFSRVCVRIRFYCIQQVSMGWVIYDFSHMILCLLWFCHGFPKWEIVKTYVNHVRNICHLELANPMTKRILLVIG